jgi:hypothetical protein
MPFDLFGAKEKDLRDGCADRIALFHGNLQRKNLFEA